MSSLPLATRRDGLVWAVVLTLALGAVGLATRPLVPIDETRYVSVAWEMWNAGTVLVPTLNGEPYSHKPPLLFWLMLLGWKAFGVSEWWPRLISPLAAVGASIGLHRLARSLWPEDEGAARVAPLLLATSLLWMVFATSTMFDALESALVVFGALGLWSAGRRPLAGWGLVAAALGAGLLTKGPVVLLYLVPAALLAPVWRDGAVEGCEDDLRPSWKSWYGGLALAVAAGALVALAWALPAARAGGEAYGRAILWGQTAGRMVGSFAHRRPFWWYLPLLPVAFFPWGAWSAPWRGLWRRGADPGVRFASAWALPALGLLSLVSGKQVHYLLPLLPALALLAARGLSGLAAADRRLPVGAAMIFGLLAVLAVLAPGLAGPLDCARCGELSRLWAVPPALLAGIVLAWRPRRLVRHLLVLAVASWSFLLVGVAGVFQTLRPAYDLRPTAEAIRRLQDAGRPVAHSGRYQGQYHYLGRLKQPLQVVGAGEGLDSWAAAHPEGYVIVYFEAGASPPAPVTEAVVTQPYRARAVGVWPAPALAPAAPATRRRRR